MIQKQNKHIVTYHSRLSDCYRNDTEIKHTQSYIPWTLSFCYWNDTETKQTQMSHTMVASVTVIGMTQK